MLLMKLPLVLSTALFSLAASDGRAEAGSTAERIEVRERDDAGAPGERGHARRDLCAMLSCTPEQRVTIEKAIDHMRERMHALHGKRDDRGKALAEAMKDGALDRAEVLEALRKNDGVREKREVIFAETLVEIHGVLDASQRELLTKLVAARGSKVLHGIGKRDRDERPAGGKGKGAGKDKPKVGKDKQAKKGAKKGGRSEEIAKRRKVGRFDREDPAADVGLTSRI